MTFLVQALARRGNWQKQEKEGYQLVFLDQTHQHISVSVNKSASQQQPGKLAIFKLLLPRLIFKFCMLGQKTEIPKSFGESKFN